MADNNYTVWIVAAVVIVLLVAGIAYVATQYINKPDDMVGMWNGTVQYQNKYYESRFVFYDNSTSEVWLFPKPNMTYNYTQIRTEASYHEKMTWQKEGDHYNLVYPDYKVELDYPNIPHTLRFSEANQTGYKTPYMGYISKNYNNIKDFGVLYNGE